MVPDREAKSISTETTFAHDIADRRVLCVWLLDLVEHLASRLRAQHVQTRTIEIKIRSSAFQTNCASTHCPKQRTLPSAVAVGQGVVQRRLTPGLVASPPSWCRCDPANAWRTGAGWPVRRR